MTSVAVILKNKTSYWSATGAQFTTWDGDYNALDWGGAHVLSSGDSFWCPVFLPHGAVVTGAIVYATATDETWTLYKKAHGTNTITSMATANMDTEDTTISNATIDNSGYSYYFDTSTMDASDQIQSAKITYTTDYD